MGLFERSTEVNVTVFFPGSVVGSRTVRMIVTPLSVRSIPSSSRIFTTMFASLSRTFLLGSLSLQLPDIVRLVLVTVTVTSRFFSGCAVLSSIFVPLAFSSNSRGMSTTGLSVSWST